jgi:hypothetical protein
MVMRIFESGSRITAVGVQRRDYAPAAVKGLRSTFREKFEALYGSGARCEVLTVHGDQGVMPSRSAVAITEASVALEFGGYATACGQAGARRRFFACGLIWVLWPKFSSDQHAPEGGEHVRD